MPQIDSRVNVSNHCRWLDELIVALWHDLQSYMEWKQLDAELMRTRGRPHAGLLLGWKRGDAERSARAASGAYMDDKDEFSDSGKLNTQILFPVVSCTFSSFVVNHGGV